MAIAIGERVSALEARCQERLAGIDRLTNTTEKLTTEVSKLNGNLKTLLVKVNIVWGVIWLATAAALKWVF